MKSFNPNHGVVHEIEEQWYKLCAILMFKFGVTKVEVTSEDIERFMESGRSNIAVHPKDRIITLTLVSDEEGKRLARKEGGLPV